MPMKSDIDIILKLFMMRGMKTMLKRERKQGGRMTRLRAELKEGFDALEASREGKLALWHHAIEKLPSPEIMA